MTEYIYEFLYQQLSSSQGIEKWPFHDLAFILESQGREKLTTIASKFEFTGGETAL